MASLDLPFRFLPSDTILKSWLARSTIVLGRLILSAMFMIVRKALSRVLSELVTLLFLLL